MSENSSNLNIGKIAVIGGGLMGRGISQFLASSGYSVNMVDLDQNILDHSFQMMRSSLETLSENGEIDSNSIPEILGRVSLFTDIKKAVCHADFVIESVSEVVDVKKRVFKDLDEFCRKDAIISSNTSGLNIFDLVPKERAKNILATHFFAPAEIIPLVEICPGPATDKNIVDAVNRLFKEAGKKTIVMKEFVPSFIVNRIQNYIGMAVFEMLSNNWATPEEIDLAVKSSLGIRLPVVGVVQTMDFTGLDLVNDMIKANGLSMPVIEEKVEKGHLGAKTSKGFYDYNGKSEKDILAKRDFMYLETRKFLEAIKASDPV